MSTCRRSTMLSVVTGAVAVLAACADTSITTSTTNAPPSPSITAPFEARPPCIRRTDRPRAQPARASPPRDLSRPQSELIRATAAVRFAGRQCRADAPDFQGFVKTRLNIAFRLAPISARSFRFEWAESLL